MFRSAAKTAAVCTNKSTMKIDKGANVMAEQSMGPRDFFRKEAAIADLALLACPGAEELCNLVDGHLVRWAREV